jgi:hypothetical protein
LKEKDKERAGLEAHVAGLLESCLRNGRLYYAGEVTDLDSKKDIKGIAADFVTTVAGVRQFLEDRSSWKEVADFLAAYDQFVEHKRDEAYRTYVAILHYARACPSLFQSVEGGRAQNALTELNADLVQASERRKISKL